MLDQTTVDFLENRGLCPETAARYGISTARNVRNTIVFPYVEGGTLINEKFRTLPKERFWQHPGRKKIFWNCDVLSDPLLESSMPLVITEGEFDALAAIQSGFPLTVSVPDGAPPVVAGPETKVSEFSAADSTGKYEFMWHARDQLRRIKRFVVAVDRDAPGQRLFSEMTRRLGAARCSFVEYPDGCKDLNDVLLAEGQEGVARVLNAAKPVPVRGLYRLSDYPDMGELATYNPFMGDLAQHFRMFTGEFIVITGIPQHGKSSFTLHLLANMAMHHGWTSAIFSPEMRVVPVIRDRLVDIYTHESNNPDKALGFIERSFVFIGSDPQRRSDDEDFDLAWIIERAKDAVLRDGIKVLLIDPWNEVEHAKGRGETLTDYVARAIRELKRFSRDYDVVTIVVAHPTKLPKGEDGQGFAVPTLYDISDSAHWFNKCDHGLVIYRKYDPPLTEIHVCKSRFDEAGVPGMVQMGFDWRTHCFTPVNVGVEPENPE